MCGLNLTENSQTHRPGALKSIIFVMIYHSYIASVKIYDITPLYFFLLLHVTLINLLITRSNNKKSSNAPTLQHEKNFLYNILESSTLQRSNMEKKSIKKSSLKILILINKILINS